MKTDKSKNNARKSRMNGGDRLICPHCREETVVKIKTLIEGWEEVGQSPVCALCGHELEQLDAAAESQPRPSWGATEPDPSVKRLASFFGEPLETNRPPSPFLDDADDVVFCKDCRYFYRHPFGDMCLKHKRAAKSMDDCSEFEGIPDTQDSKTDGDNDDGKHSDG